MGGLALARGQRQHGDRAEAGAKAGEQIAGRRSAMWMKMISPPGAAWVAAVLTQRSRRLGGHVAGGGAGGARGGAVPES